MLIARAGENIFATIKAGYAIPFFLQASFPCTNTIQYSMYIRVAADHSGVERTIRLLLKKPGLFLLSVTFLKVHIENTKPQRNETRAPAIHFNQGL